MNQDAVLVTGLAGGAELIAVADGMGGHSAGEVASRRALEVLRVSLEADRELVAAVRAANEAIFREANAQPDHAGMGTTLVALLRRGASYMLANVGDSRAYRIDGRGIQQLTDDHSFVAEAVRSGQLSAAEAEKSRWRNAVTRALGTDADVEVDVHGPFDALESHFVLLCSDGLHRVLRDTDVWNTVLRTTPENVARQLVTAAFDAGSDDNITVALVRFGAQPVAQPAPAPPRSELPVRRQSRRRVWLSRWTLIQISVIFMAFIAVVALIALLTLAL